MTELIISNLTGKFGSGKPLNSSFEMSWSTNELFDITSGLPIVKANVLINFLDLKYQAGSFKSLILNTKVKWDIFEKFNTSFSGIKTGTHSVDVNGKLSFQMVNLQGTKVDPKREYRYIPTSDFQINSELVSFTGNFIEPVDLSVIKTRLSPVDSGTEFPWSRTTVVDIYQELTYGYSINNFLIGGSVRTDYLIDDDAINPPPDPPATGGVTKIVNVINVVKLPERTPIDFVDFVLATDLNSIAWVVDFTIGSKASLDLLKPVGLTTVEVEIDVNGELWNCFIGRTKTILTVKKGGGVQKSYRCTGWSLTKLLTYPYSTRRSHTETSSSTPSGLVNDELTGSGFVGTWSSPSWTIPANVFSYLEKSPLAAIVELSESIGSVIIPNQVSKTFEIKPYYPVSPWDWGTTTSDFNMNETEFYSMDTEWIPKESPDSIFVYGEETNGVAVKCVRQGTAGLITLPTIVNKYITDTIAGTERGRIEVAKNAFKETIPVTTYVDANDGVIKPQSILSITPVSGTTWKGMVIGTSIRIKRRGSAVVQSLQIERHYD